ncbi:potassium channel family protein [Halomicrobium urmianum]|uniref:potassium channel family protein n=1 Tax=Halomicrobium urmianum TaxID=1586233 RepID=UPI001CD99DD6|nr:potassium channel family protein [Halomicrobium urmianum]
MTAVETALGAAVLVGTVLDVLWTTLWVSGGAGPLTARLATWTWRGWRAIGRDSLRVRSLAGPVILVLGLFSWIALLWAGWVLLFSGLEAPLLDTRDGGPVSLTERFYFVGYSLFTMGNGDFAPRDGAPQVATALTTASGMLFVTLAVTYVLSVLDAVTQKRSFARSVTGLGTSGEAIALAGWDGEGFDDLDLSLQDLSAQLDALSSNHKAYPILHYFYSPERERAPSVAIPALDEALTLLRFGVDEAERPNRAALGSARSSVGGYLDTLTTTFVSAADETPPPPSLDRLRAAGVDTVDEDAFADALADLRERRRRLLDVARSDVREWPESDGE